MTFSFKNGLISVRKIISERKYYIQNVIVWEGVPNKRFLAISLIWRFEKAIEDLITVAESLSALWNQSFIAESETLALRFAFC